MQTFIYDCSCGAESIRVFFLWYNLLRVERFGLWRLSMARMTKKLREQIIQRRVGGLCNPFGIGSYYVVLALKELYLTPDCLMADVEVLDTPQGRIIKRLSECGSEFILTPRFMW